MADNSSPYASWKFTWDEKKSNETELDPNRNIDFAEAAEILKSPKTIRLPSSKWDRINTKNRIKELKEILQHITRNPEGIRDTPFWDRFKNLVRHMLVLDPVRDKWIGEFNEKIYVVITKFDGLRVFRIISVRRAREKEISAFLTMRTEEED